MAARSSRWITVRQSFDYRWPSGAITAFTAADLGEHLVKDELADFAVEKGYATEGKVDGSARSKKGGPKRVRRAKRGATPAKAANAGPVDRVDATHLADDDRAGNRDGVDQASG